jgi:prephenate dehydrogenase
MEDTIKKYIIYAKENSIILDVTSIKDGPSKSMFENAPKNSLVIPTHPMF